MKKYYLIKWIILAAFYFNSCNCNPTQNPSEDEPRTKQDPSPASPTNTPTPTPTPISKPQNVGLVIITKLDGAVKHVLIHMRYDNKLAGPGGAIDPTPDGSMETPEAAGRRESKEESGLDIPLNELQQLGQEHNVVMLLWNTNINTVPGPDFAHTHEVKLVDPIHYDAKDAGGKHMWISLDALEKHEKDFLPLFFKYAKTELKK